MCRSVARRRLLDGDAARCELGLWTSLYAPPFYPEPLGDGSLSDSEAAGDVLDVSRALDRVAHGEQHGTQAVDDTARFQRGIVLAPGDEALEEEAREGSRVLDGGAPGFRILAREVIGVLAHGQGGDAQVEVDLAGDRLGAALGSAHRLGRAEVEEEGAGALGGGHAGAVGVPWPARTREAKRVRRAAWRSVSDVPIVATRLRKPACHGPMTSR